MKRKRQAVPTRGGAPPPLKPTTFLLLLTLAEGERHGYALKKAVLKRTGGRVDLGPATLYRSLGQLSDLGLIEESDRRPAPELDDERRRYYRLTPAGRKVAAAEAQRLAELVGAARAARLVDEPGRP
jgi:DNA-binding PadR family transcriptional regulator